GGRQHRLDSRFGRSGDRTLRGSGAADDFFLRGFRLGRFFRGGFLDWLLRPLLRGGLRGLHDLLLRHFFRGFSFRGRLLLRGLLGHVKPSRKGSDPEKADWTIQYSRTARLSNARQRLFSTSVVAGLESHCGRSPTEPQIPTEGLLSVRETLRSRVRRGRETRAERSIPSLFDRFWVEIGFQVGRGDGRSDALRGDFGFRDPQAGVEDDFAVLVVGPVVME